MGRKQLVRLHTRKLKRNPGTLLVADQNNAMMTNYINVNIDYTQQSKSRFCREKYEMINHIESEIIKLMQKEY